MIPWKLTADFDKQRHLFFEKIETGYIIESYVCSCGHADFIIKHKKQDLKYQCKECENTKFYDANSAWRNIEHFLYQNLDLELSYEFDFQSNDEKISSLYVTQIPTGIDFASKKVIFSKKSVYNLSLMSDGELKENYSLKFNQDIFFQLKKNLNQHINAHGCFNIPDSKEKNLTLKIALFFLKNKHLKDFDLYYWDCINSLKGNVIDVNSALLQISNNRKEKSIKKALYENYRNQIANHGKFYSFFIEAFTKVLNDPNIIVDLLKIDFEYQFIKDTVNVESLFSLIAFLKQHYLEKQIFRLFNRAEFSSNLEFFSDALREFNDSKDVIKSKFRKVSCKVQALHNEFVRCSKEERYKYIQGQRLEYSKKTKEACIAANTYQVKLPTSGKELFEWAEDLNNCMAGYFDMIKNNETIIYGFFVEDILAFAVEINEKRVVQASGKYNANLTVREQDILTKWFELFFQEDKQMIKNVT